MEIPSGKLFLLVNRQEIVISLSLYPCRDLPIGLLSEIISRMVFPYIPNSFWHTEKFRFPAVYGSTSVPKKGFPTYSQY